MNNTGLSTTQAEILLKRYGPNDVSEKSIGVFKKFVAPLYSPISLMLSGAAMLSYFHGKIFDFYFIIVLCCVNYMVQKWQEFKADKAIEHLRNKLSFDVLALRDGRWQLVSVKLIVPGDRVKLGLGSIMPADAVALETRNLTMNESALTGESLPKEKKPGDGIFSGSYIATGELEAEITATGKRTYFGKTILSIEQTAQRSILERDIISISRFLMMVSIAAVSILTLAFAWKGFPLADLLTLDISLIIAGIPIALPTVMAVILSIGAGGLAKKMVVVRRLSALQDLANVNLLLTDKTGTLTKNEIRVANIISYENSLSTNDIMELAGYAISPDTPDAIDMAVIKKMEEAGQKPGDKERILSFIPYDSERKRSTALIQKNGTKMLVSMGAPQVIRAFNEHSSEAMAKRFEDDISRAAADGYRTLAVAISSGDHPEEKHMIIVGLILLADPLDENSSETLRFVKENGIDVKMLTGDNAVIAEKIARQLNLSGDIVFGKEAGKLLAGGTIGKSFSAAAAFAEVLPNDKYEIVKAAKSRYIVAVTGDGINDMPALKIAHVGIAVNGAVSALKSMADIVLLGHGIAVIKDAIIESRKIFTRLYYYSVYRISESFRLIITILILGLWYGFYPLLPLQLILLALLNDIPIISLATDRVRLSAKPSEINPKERLILSVLFGSVGVVNSILLFILMTKVFHFSLPYIQTLFFLKLTVSGHALIFVAHTKERWFKFLPSRSVILAIFATQIAATILAVSGFLMPAKISYTAAIFVWAWALLWMQISELMKDIQIKIKDKKAILMYNGE